ncbi:MAG: GGDEF domain-containing protein [Pseudomonadota bacterium]
MSSRNEPPKPNRPDRVWLLGMVRVLQTTLDVEQLLRLFSNKCAELVAHSGVRYSPEESTEEVRLGRIARHSCQYDLEVDSTPIGTLWFTRGTPFSETDTEILETLISNLVYPLRNALAYRDMENAAARDALTGLFNRGSMVRSLTREVQLAQRHNVPLSIIILDIDHFKSVNDTFGHVVGDAVLIDISERLMDRVRNSDIVFRYGGEEFVVLLSATDLEGAKLLAGRLRTRVEEEPVKIKKMQLSVPVTISAGVAELAAGETMDALLSRADTALYRAKDAGRNRVHAAPAPVK